jgi:hypothetical protein
VKARGVRDMSMSEREELAGAMAGCVGVFGWDLGEMSIIWREEINTLARYPRIVL